MHTGRAAKSIITPIVVAEGMSTIVSMGAVLAMAHGESAVNPVRDFVAKRLIYPLLSRKPALAGIDTSDPLFEKACDQATILVKGSAMIGAGFATHVPIQLALEGHCDAKSIRQVLVGKSTGISVALGSILMLNTLIPKALPSLQKTVCPLLAPYLPQSCDRGRSAAEETCHLMTVEVPSSVISGLVNYAITRRALRV